MRRRARAPHRDTDAVSTPPEPPPRLNDHQLELIRTALLERGAMLPCPRCGNNAFGLEDQMVLQPVQATMQGYQLGGQTIPAVITICSRCGWLSLHALGSLDLLHHPAFNPDAAARS